MLTKLLKYDFKAIFKYWWIAAISSIGLSVLGGGGLMLMNAEMDLPAVVSMTVISVLILVVLSFSVFVILSMILVIVRFYKNFFTDEGYLTFTLPVRRTQLLNSKLIAGGVVTVATYLICAIDVFILLFCGIGGENLFGFLGELFTSVTRTMEPFGLLFWLELLVLFAVWLVFSLLLPFCCVSFASVLTKKARVITAIGLYYGINTMISFLLQLFFFFGLSSLMDWLYSVPQGMAQPLVILILFGAILLVSVFCAVLYAVQYWMLDRKLNLA